MARSPRSFKAGFCYHVTVRCNNREFRLIRDECREILLYATQNRRVHSRSNAPKPIQKEIRYGWGVGWPRWRCIAAKGVCGAGAQKCSAANAPYELTQEKNRLAISPEALKPSIERHINFIKAEIKALKKQVREHIQAHERLQTQADLLVSIVGIGVDTAARLLAELGDISAFGSARQLAAYAGLTPQEHTSGTSVNGKTRLCKIGNARMRKALYFPAIAFLRCAPELQPWQERLKAAGKTKMAIIGAAMHKLIRIVYGVLASGQKYDPDKLKPPKTAPVTP